MKNIKWICVLILLLGQLKVLAQTQVTGTIVSPYKNKPIEGAVIAINSGGEVILAETDSEGKFSIEVASLDQNLKINAPGFIEVIIPILGRTEVNTVLVPDTKVNYNQRPDDLGENLNMSQTITRRNFKPGALYLEDVIQTAFPGLYVVNKSGMPGEGAYMNYRGIRSLRAENFPLIVLNGVPFIPDLNNSAIISGYARSVLSGINVNNVESITLLKGADAAVYGSMGANGVLMIETSKATDLETRIQFSGQYGVSYNTAKMPVMGTDAFKEYIGDVGLTRYDDAANILVDFPFLKYDSTYFFNYLYNNNTDWQDLIYEPTFITANNLNVKGGDAIARYDFSVGYHDQGGAIKNTGFTRYNARLNANINLGKKVEFISSFGISFINGRHHNQGLLEASNPILASLYKAPILNPYRKDEDNNELPEYDIYRQFNVSNPLAVANTVSIETSARDVFFTTGLKYDVSPDLKVSSLFGLYSGYSRQNGFVPGKSSLAIVPREDGVALNSASAGIGESSNVYYNINGQYTKTLAGRRLVTGLGYQGIITRREFDAGDGRNTSSDFYKTLRYISIEGSRYFGYIDLWNWMSVYGYATYDISDALKATVNFSYDGSSASGTDATRFGIFPGANLTWNVKNMPFLRNSENINALDVSLDFSMLGNSRFSSKIGKQYYGSQIYRQLSGIVSSNVANTNLSWENNQNIDLGVNGSFLRHRLRASLNVFQTLSSDVIIPKEISPVFGTTAMNINAGEITTRGAEFAIQADVIQTKDYGVTIGGNASNYTSEVTSLGGTSEIISVLPDGTTLITKEGEAPYTFYGYKAEGVFSTQSEADAAGLSDSKGDMFSAGDIRFVDFNDDGLIDKNDRTIIGDSNPDLFGGLFVNVRYNRFTLSSYFQYSIGNEAYNATRRELESMDQFYNQSTAVERRWQTEGQITDIPKASYDDPMGNSRFSDRWIEDASYIRLTNLVLSYSLTSRTSGIIKGGDIYIAGENLYTATNYLGLDPVHAYSYQPMHQGVDYAKQALPRTYKIGFNLLF